jgi:hypothetical protein
MTSGTWTAPDASKAGATLETFVLEGMFKVPGATGMFTSVLNQISLAGFGAPGSPTCSAGPATRTFRAKVFRSST